MIEQSTGHVQVIWGGGGGGPTCTVIKKKIFFAEDVQGLCQTTLMVGDTSVN